MNSFHKAVLLKESIEGLSLKADGIYVDATYGGGGHSKEILKKLQNGRLITFEQDGEAIKNWKMEDGRWKMVNPTSNFQLLNSNFRYIKNFLNYNGINKIDGLLADLGVSSYQINTAERGFSHSLQTSATSEVDMRMNKNKKISAKTIINEYSEEKLRNIFRNYGELDNAFDIAKSIIDYRYKTVDSGIKTTQDLIKAIGKNIPKNNEMKFLSKVFQAIRIEVNDEIESLKEMLLQTIDLLNPKGRIVIISYHSLEDRLVKNFIRAGNFEGKVNKDFYGNQVVPFNQVNKKVITPSEEEIKKNNRARSAKLRIGERSNY